MWSGATNSIGSFAATALKPAAPMPAPPIWSWPVATWVVISAPPGSRTSWALMPPGVRYSKVTLTSFTRTFGGGVCIGPRFCLSAVGRSRGSV